MVHHFVVIECGSRAKRRPRFDYFTHNHSHPPDLFPKPRPRCTLPVHSILRLRHVLIINLQAINLEMEEPAQFSLASLSAAPIHSLSYAK